MSKPNLLGFSSSIGIYRNNRIRELREILQRSIPRKVEFAELAPMLFQAVMAYAGENQIDGNFDGYTKEQWAEIFASNHIAVSAPEASIIIKAFDQVGLFEDEKIRSWSKYNRHFAAHEQIIKAKRKASQMWQKKRAQQLHDSLKKTPEFPSEPAPKPEKNGAQGGSESKQIWLIEKQLENAQGDERRQLLARKKELLTKATGVKRREPTPEPARAKTPKSSPGEFQRAYLNSARSLVADSPGLLTDKMVTALLDAGDPLPASVQERFRKLLEQREKEEARNPIPG